MKHGSMVYAQVLGIAPFACLWAAVVVVLPGSSFVVVLVSSRPHSPIELAVVELVESLALASLFPLWSHVQLCCVLFHLVV